MAHSLTRLSGVLFGVSALAACYAPQPRTLTPSMSPLAFSAPSTHEVHSPADMPTEWSADAMVKRAMERNPDLLSWAARVEASAASIDVAGAFDDVEVRLTRAELSEFERGDPRVDIALRGRPPRPGDLASREDAARLRVDEIAARRDDARRGIRAEVRRLHAMLVFDERERVLLAQEERVRLASLASERARLELSDTNKLDVILVELELAEVRDALSALEVQIREREAGLRALIDLPLEAAMSLVGAPGGISEDAPALDPMLRQRWVEEGLKARPALRESSAALGRARADEYRAGVERWPWLGWVELSYEVTEDPNPLEWGLALSLDLPIFAWTGAESRAAEALTRQRQQEHEGAFHRVQREIEGAFTGAYASRARFDRLQGSLVEVLGQASKVLESEDDSRASAPSLTMRLDVARIRAKRRALDAHRDWILAYISLYAAAGR